MPEIEELKRVPCRCGGKAFIQMDFSPESFTRGCYKVVCNDCNMQTGWKQTAEKAVELWNRVMSDETAMVINKEIDYYGGQYEKGKCGICKHRVIIEYDFCPNCGRKLIWEEEENNE